MSAIPSKRMPALFLGHGSPMNAIEQNDFTHFLQNLPSTLPAPKEILMISAHWMTRGTFATHMSQPKTIHDFYGFPQALFDVQYPAPGSPNLAEQLTQTISHPSIGHDDHEWGLDHGAWSVLTHIYPDANVPVVQLSLDMTQPGGFYLKLGKQLRTLREQGVLIIGSGNIVHNLRQTDRNLNATPLGWAQEFDEWVKEKMIERNFDALSRDFLSAPSGRLANPTLDHYLPLLYVLGTADEKDEISFIYEGIQNASISMRCVRVG